MLIALLAGIALALALSADLLWARTETKAALGTVQEFVPSKVSGQRHISGATGSNFLAAYFNKRCRTERPADDPEVETQVLQRLVGLPVAMLQILRGEH